MLTEVVFSPDEINNILRLIVEYLMLVLGTSIGTFSREAIYPKQNGFRENVGWLLLSASIAFGVTIKFDEYLTMAYTFLICVASGFFVPAFKDWFEGKKIIRVAIKTFKKVNSASDSLLDEIDEELYKEENTKSEDKTENDDKL